jgi:hypothetical protein
MSCILTKVNIELFHFRAVLVMKSHALRSLVNVKQCLATTVAVHHVVRKNAWSV